MPKTGMATDKLYKAAIRGILFPIYAVEARSFVGLSVFRKDHDFSGNDHVLHGAGRPEQAFSARCQGVGSHNISCQKWKERSSFYHSPCIAASGGYLPEGSFIYGGAGSQENRVIHCFIGGNCKISRNLAENDFCVGLGWKA